MMPDIVGGLALAAFFFGLIALAELMLRVMLES